MEKLCYHLHKYGILIAQGLQEGQESAEDQQWSELRTDLTASTFCSVFDKEGLPE